MRRDVFQAIADPTRRAIICLLAAQSMTPNAIAEHFDCSRQAVSKHLQLLADCELLSSYPKGREVLYELKPEKLTEIDQWLKQFRALWETRFDQLDKLLNTLKNTQE